MAYLYRHIRHDKNQPFYIGIGCSANYKRAYDKDKRNILWKAIVNKTSYDIQIIFDNISWEKACEKETEFINLYGRIDNKTGILSNMTDGGDGMKNHIQSKETKERRSKSMIGRKLTDKHKINLSLSKKGKKPSKETKIKMSISSRNRQRCKHGDEAKQKMSKAKKEIYLGGNNPRAKKVIDTKTGITYSNAKEVSRLFSINYNTLNTWLINNRKDKTQFEYESKKDI